MSKPIAIFDMDGTLTVVGDRLKYITLDEDRKRKDWPSFLDACGEDEVNEPIAEIYTLMRPHYYTIILTGRDEKYYDVSMDWLRRNKLPYPDATLMRPHNDRRHDTIVKPEVLERWLKEDDRYMQYHVKMVFEDRASMVDMWRAIGYTCLQVAPGDF